MPFFNNHPLSTRIIDSATHIESDEIRTLKRELDRCHQENENLRRSLAVSGEGTDERITIRPIVSLAGSTTSTLRLEEHEQKLLFENETLKKVRNKLNYTQ